uniref:Uncharacterized protein n=1 Tax=Anguilla anguilla TaxID=7936 RepID=A0A0E9PBR8_ANGAN
MILWNFKKCFDFFFFCADC